LGYDFGFDRGWLAVGLGCHSLLLVKQSDTVQPGATVLQLTKDGIVDAGLETLLPSDIDLHVAGPRHPARRGCRSCRRTDPGVLVGSRNSSAKAG
jgi:dihydroneopterin aldolase